MAQNGNVFTYKLKTVAGLQPKAYASSVGFRLCREVACTTVYPGSSKSFVYSLNVDLLDWTTLQRNAAHNGYVHAAFDPAVFVKKWVWSQDAAVAFEPVVARKGSVFVTVKQSTGRPVVHEIEGTNGLPGWATSPGDIRNASAPVLVGNYLAVNSISSDLSTKRTSILDAVTGGFLKEFRFASQVDYLSQPAGIGNELYFAAGAIRNVLYGYNVSPFQERWIAGGSDYQARDGESPAIDDKYVYYYSDSLEVFDRASGSLVKRIADMRNFAHPYGYYFSPILGSTNNVIAASGSRSNASVSIPLNNFDVAAGTIRWRSARNYSNVPALAKGVLYAPSNENHQLDALSELTGTVLWSWSPPTPQETFIGNVIVTDTLLFVSTTAKTYAIALDGAHDVKWSAPEVGQLAIIPDGKLVIVPEKGTKITAYTLQ